MAQRRAVLAIAALAALVIGGAGWYFTRPAPEAAAQGSAAAEPVAVPPSAAQQPAVPGAAAPAAATAASAPAPDEVERLQLRLDALAKAYNERDVRGVERAMFRNHAVVRPTGETMQGAELIGQWTREWADFRKHRLSFVVEQVSREGSRITATWDLALDAELVDAQGVAHAMEINAAQRASYNVDGDDWVLDGPIEYVGFERTIDGDPWPLGQNGR